MTGAMLNAAAILVGGLIGLQSHKRLAPGIQNAIKALLGAFTVWIGLSSVWRGLQGPFLHLLGQLGIAALALVLGNLVGKTFRLQRTVSRWAEVAQQRLARPTHTPASRINDGFLVCTILYCATPMAVIGSLQDGLSGHWQLLAVKAVMEGLATVAFVPMLGWGVVLAALPVFAWLGTLSLLGQWLAAQLTFPGAVESLEVMSGLLCFTLALLVFEVRRVPVTNYLPALLFAPLLTWLFT
jgi:hypothetical protein